MRKPLAALLLPLALAACVKDSVVDTGVVPRAAYAPLTAPAQIFPDARAVMAYYLASAGRASPSEQQVDDYPGTGGDVLLLFSADGLEDDSIEAMQWRVLLVSGEAGVRVVEAGVRQKCRRSGSNQWTTALCP